MSSTHTDYAERGIALSRLNDRQRRFVLEYLIDYNGSRAAIAAGYAKKGASVRATNLLKHRLVMAAIGKTELQTRKRLEASREDVLEQLAYCATRSGADFVDEDGILIENVHKLPLRAQNAIDGIKQKVKRYTLPNGTEVAEVETEFKLVPKASAIDMAMRHRGLFAPEKQVVKHTMDLDSLLGRGEVIDNVEVRLLEEEQNNGESS